MNEEEKAGTTYWHPIRGERDEVHSRKAEEASTALQMMLFINDPDMKRRQKAKRVRDLSRFKRAHERLNETYTKHMKRRSKDILGVQEGTLKARCRWIFWIPSLNIYFEE